MPTSDIRELLVVETAGADTTSAEAQTIPVMGTPIGQAFLQRTPRRRDGIDLDIDGIDSTARRWSFPRGPPTPSPAYWWPCGTTEHSRSATNNST